MDEMNEVYEQCEECLCEVNMMEIVVKETAEGNCIYCPKCVEHHKFLAQEEKRLCKLWGIDMIKYGQQVEKEERRLLKANKERK
jgi:hypothetical protein